MCVYTELPQNSDEPYTTASHWIAYDFVKIYIYGSGKHRDGLHVTLETIPFRLD